MMKYDLCKKVKKFEFHIPILGIRVDDFDSGSSLVSLASDWNGDLVLKPTLMQFSVFTFFTKVAKCVCDLGRSFLVLCTRVRFSICMAID